MKKRCCILIITLLSVACGNKTTALPSQPEKETAGAQLGIGKGELTSEGYITCNPAVFVPLESRFMEIDGSKDLAFGLSPSQEFNGKATVSIWSRKSQCKDNVHKMAFYGVFETPITTQKGQDNIVRYFVQRDDAIYLVGSSEEGKMPLCLGVENCAFTLTTEVNGKIVLRLSVNNSLLVNEEIKRDSEPKFIPVIGGKP